MSASASVAFFISLPVEDQPFDGPWDHYVFQKSERTFAMNCYVGKQFLTVGNLFIPSSIHYYKPEWFRLKF